MSFPKRATYLVGLVLAAAGLVAVSARAADGAAVDPVADLRARADSLMRIDATAALARLVADRSILIGAAVGTLLDDAFDASVTEDSTLEHRDLRMAERLAHLHADSSRVPLELIATYRSWTPAQRETKARAMELEAQVEVAHRFQAFDRAVELLEQAQALYREIGDRRALAVNYGSLGVSHWYRADMAAVRENYEKALEARRAIEDRILEGRTLNGLGSTNLRTGDYEAAIAFYRSAIALRRRTGDLTGLGTSLTYLGTCYYRMNHLVEARDYFEEALPILEHVGDAQRMIEILNAVANLYSDMNRFDAANDAYRRAIDIALGANVPADEATCRINLASNLQMEGRYSEALEQLDVASRRLEKQPDPFHLATLYRTRAAVWVAVGELDRAREDLMALLEQSQGLKDPFYFIDAQLMTAGVYEALGAYDRALGAAEKAIVTARRHEITRMERDGEATAARIQTQRGNYDAALTHWRAALAVSEADGSAGGVMEARLGMALVFAQSGEREKARAICREQVALAVERDLPQYRIAAHTGIAHTYEDENPDSAMVHYEAALAVYEQSLRDLRASSDGTEFLSGNRRFVYEEVARYYARLYAQGRGVEWSARAFHTVESAKARGLLDQLRESVAMASTPAEEALLDSLYALKARSPDDGRSVRAVERRYRAARARRVAESTRSIEAAGPVEGPDAVRRVLDGGTVMLSYALGDTASLLWVIDRDGSDLVTLPARGELTTAVERLRDAISRPGPGDDALRTAARSLYHILVEPAAAALEGAERLVIAPDGILFELPFETLLERDPEPGTSWSGLAFLGREVPVVYVPSASVFAALERSTRDEDYDLELIAIGDPDYGPDSGLERIPYTRDEVNAIGARVDRDRRKVYVGSEASETRLKGLLRSTRPRILHLAAHGLIDPNNPSASSIALCEPDNSKEDGRLYTLEVASVGVHAGLVVLSACESARGRLSRSEGVVGLSRAFLGSGAGGVVASLWAVSDESTAVLMKEMYRRMLDDREPAAEALRDARVALLNSKQYSHPFYWAPFIAIGTDTSPW